MSETEFSVATFFPDGSYEYVKRWLTADDAVKTAYQLIRPERPANMLGIIERVIITDGGDFIVFEWKKDKGVTFPPELEALYKEKGLPQC